MLPAIDGYVAPAQVRNIAYTQSAIAGKQKCPAYILLDIGGVLQFADFVKGQELTLAFRSRYLFLGAQQFPRIVLYIPFCQAADRMMPRIQKQEQAVAWASGFPCGVRGSD